MTPRRARPGLGWIHLGPLGGGLNGQYWVNEEAGLEVISSVTPCGNQVHVGARHVGGKRCTDAELASVRVAFDMVGAEEDNVDHLLADTSRNLWLFVAKGAA